jgi:hypothetical protein
LHHIHIAGISYDIDDYDGRALFTNDLQLTANDNNGDNNWRDTFLSQYIALGTKTLTGCSAWYPDINGSVYPGTFATPPATNSNNQAYMMDDLQIGNWRALRILNETANLMYVEWIQLPWNQTQFENPFWNEFYNVALDPYQMNNQYRLLSASVQAQLHAQLMMYGACKGQNCF